MKTALLLLIYLGLLVWALRQKQKRFDGPWWFHLRAFLPNWKFYHAIGWMPRLMVRLTVLRWLMIVPSLVLGLVVMGTIQVTNFEMKSASLNYISSQNQ